MKRFILGILIIVVVALIVAFATGYLTLNSTGQLKAPALEVQATGGELPKLDVDSKQIVVGTTDANVGVPSVGMRNTTIKVPVVGMKSDEPAAETPPANGQ